MTACRRLGIWLIFVLLKSKSFPTPLPLFSFHFLYSLYYNFPIDLSILSINVLLYSDPLIVMFSIILGLYNATIPFFCCKWYSNMIWYIFQPMVINFVLKCPNISSSPLFPLNKFDISCSTCCHAVLCHD